MSDQEIMELPTHPIQNLKPFPRNKPQFCNQAFDTNKFIQMSQGNSLLQSLKSPTKVNAWVDEKE